MAYYSSSYYDSNLGEYYQTPYDDGSHEFFSSEASGTNSSYAYKDYDYNNNYNCVDPCYYSAYDPAPYNGSYDPDFNCSTIAYSSYTFSEPKYVEYGMDPYGGDYSTVKTRFIISYSVADDQFNMPIFEDYDPTPYGGGYDIDATYGKPLPPSEGICYPPSSADPNDVSSNFSYGSIPSPYGKDRVDEPVAKPSNGSKTAPAKEQEQPVHNVGSNGKPADSPHCEESKENYPDVSSAPSDQGNGAIRNGGSECEQRVSQIPPGYGLEAMDLCESLFGYWPCLARAKRETDHRNCQGVCSKANYDNCPWEGTADYLFGNSFPYGGRWGNGGIYENPIFNYERHYQEQHLSRQVEYHEEYSWLN